LLLLTGCASRNPQAQIRNPRTTLVFLPGAGGRLPVNEEFIYAILQERIATEAIQLDWTHQRNLGQVMREVDRNHAFAESVRDELRAIRKRNPNGQIILAAHSAGTGIAVWALEQAGEPLVDDLLLLAPALSKDYDLGPALSHVKHHAWAYWCPLDVTILGAGTKSMGTIDRKFEPAAGLTGFSFADPKFTQVKIDYADLHTTTAWAHVSVLTQEYVHDEVAPRLRSR
jgi:pimeloyl-ACP methyl ester carboxylesterase